MSGTPKQGRGKGRSICERQADAVDRMILVWLKEGVECLDPATGEPKRDADGKVVRRELSATHLGKITSWIGDRNDPRKRGGRKSHADLLDECVRRMADGRIQMPTEPVKEIDSSEYELPRLVGNG